MQQVSYNAVFCKININHHHQSSTRSSLATSRGVIVNERSFKTTQPQQSKHQAVNCYRLEISHRKWFRQDTVD